jgi:hypothetical protein
MNNKVIMIKVDNGHDLSNLNHESKNLHGKFCDKPFKTFSVRDDGSCWMCCTSWLPYSIGNLNEQTFDEIWHGDKARLILPVVPVYPSQIKHAVPENEEKVGDVNLTHVSAVYSVKAPFVTPGLLAVVIEGNVK